MAQLDKTFPTNDCAMCIMAPKLVATGRHHNIQLITNAEIAIVDGQAGNFTVTVKQRAFRVDTTKCTGCGSVRPEVPDRDRERVRRGHEDAEGDIRALPPGGPAGLLHRPGEVHRLRHLRRGVQGQGRRVRPEGEGPRDQGRVHHPVARVRRVQREAEDRVRLRRLPERRHEHRVREDAERDRPVHRARC